MKIEIDIDEAYDAIVEEYRSHRYSRPNLKEVTEQVTRIIDVATASCEDMTQVLFDIASASETIKLMLAEKLGEVFMPSQVFANNENVLKAWALDHGFVPKEDD